GGLAGTWQLQASDDPGDLQDQPTVSFAGFRVDEVLSTIGDFTAAGRTADVSGTVELSDTELLAAEVTVMMSTLRTDNSFRDGRIYEALNTSDFPTATFVLAAPLGLPPGLADGEAFSGVAEGDLTIKGVTNRVSFSLEAQLLGDRLLAVGRSEVVFSDYGVTAPTAPIVVSVEDHGIMEFQLFFAR
ncbi:MAG: YceI family protein, partial [Acidimicrobiaceae bacterium]|nr:YceI family protein [Acidimicrobiaceae bacterium]